MSNAFHLHMYTTNSTISKYSYAAGSKYVSGLTKVQGLTKHSCVTYLHVLFPACCSNLHTHIRIQNIRHSHAFFIHDYCVGETHHFM